MRSNECTHNHVAAETPSTPRMASPTPTTTPSSPATTTSSSSYHYTHLERDQIRLVVLEPATDPSHTLVCRILTCHRNDAPPYEAISFTPPSDDNTTSTITVLPPILAPTSPTPLQIPSSTAEALATLRLHTGPRTLYLPALSINASSPSERSSQLLLTPSIFHAATRVTIPLLSAQNHTEAITY
ncbi:heterokaryon incompatibility protein, partial [Colletotrichum chrysophilum]